MCSEAFWPIVSIISTNLAIFPVYFVYKSIHSICSLSLEWKSFLYTNSFNICYCLWNNCLYCQSYQCIIVRFQLPTQLLRNRQEKEPISTTHRHYHVLLHFYSNTSMSYCILAIFFAIQSPNFRSGAQFSHFRKSATREVCRFLPFLL